MCPDSVMGVGCCNEEVLSDESMIGSPFLLLFSSLLLSLLHLPLHLPPPLPFLCFAAITNAARCQPSQ